MLPAVRPDRLSVTTKTTRRPAAWSASIASKNAVKSSSESTRDTKYRQMSGSIAISRIGSRSASATGVSRTYSFSRRTGARSRQLMRPRRSARTGTGR